MVLTAEVSHPRQLSSLSKMFHIFLVISHHSAWKGMKEIPTLACAMIQLQHKSV